MQRTGQVLTLSAGQLNLLFVLMPAAILLIVATVLRLFPALWAHTVQGSEDTRNRSMDGARGLLTLWVLTHHLNVLALGPHGDLRAGSGAVSLLMGSSFFTAPFYMLTAMLFGGALLASKGAFDTPRFLRRRFFRLAPAYLVSIALVVLAAFAMTGFELRVDPLKLLKQVARWCSFGFLPRYDINGADVSDWHGMLWTLRYEIGFYLLLPLLAWAQRRTGSPAVVVLALAGVGLFAWPFIFFTAGVLSTLR